jgi:nucleotidyltransferase substrate binding protein (TIGR01987 family)
MGQQERFDLALSHFGKALSRLKEVLAEPQETSIVRDAIIQRFEFTFEAAWKAMYRWLRARGNDLDEDAASTIPAAFARRLILSEQGWGHMRKFRNKTSHTYDESLAIEVAAFVRHESVVLFDALLQTLQERGLE